MCEYNVRRVLDYIAVSCEVGLGLVYLKLGDYYS